MYRVIYVSSETVPFTEAALDEMLQKSRHSNAAADITGLLLYKDGVFMQILEGPKPAVLALLAKIKVDRRHRNVALLLEGETDTREFQEWSMGFKKLDANTSREVPGYKNFDQLALSSNQFLANPSKSLGLLLAFKASRL